MSAPPPSPHHLLRTHSAAVNVVYFSQDNERLYSGDASGFVVVTSTRTLRPLASWKAHTDSILGIEEFEGQIITHGRDNKLHVWSYVQEVTSTLGSSAILSDLKPPELCYSMDVNALNYCRFSLMPTSASGSDHALIALPNLVESSLADVWALPSRQRLHAAIGKSGSPNKFSDGRGAIQTGIIMSLCLMQSVHPHSERAQLRLLCAYENGAVTLWAYTRADKDTSVEGIGWETVWTSKLYVESIMAMAVSRDRTFALTVSADHLVGRYNIGKTEEQPPETAFTVHRTKHPGNGSVAIRDDGKVCAIGGWDGKIRLYSAKSLKPLGTLEYHKKGCQSVAFARSSPEVNSNFGDGGTDEAYDDQEMTDAEKAERCRWLAAGSLDQRVSIWKLIDFTKP